MTGRLRRPKELTYLEYVLLWAFVTYCFGRDLAPEILGHAAALVP